MTPDIKQQINKLLENMPPGDRMRVLKFCENIQLLRASKRAARVGSHQRRSPELSDWRVGK